MLWREQRRAYGEIKVDPLKPRILDDFSVGYTGHQADKESGLTYAKARYYNKEVGRFYAPDPIPFRESDLTSINRYAYASNNPYMFFDPWGTQNLIQQRRAISSALNGTTMEEEAKRIAENNAQREKFVVDSVKVGAITAAEMIPAERGLGIIGKILQKLGFVKKATKPAAKTAKVYQASSLAQSRINVAWKATRFTPLRSSGHPYKAGFKHVLEDHFDRELANSRSVFNITPEKLKSILQSPQVVRSPVKSIEDGKMFVRIADTGTIIGNAALKQGGGLTSKIKVITDAKGNLMTTFPVK